MAWVRVRVGLWLGLGSGLRLRLGLGLGLGLGSISIPISIPPSNYSEPDSSIAKKHLGRIEQRNEKTKKGGAEELERKIGAAFAGDGRARVAGAHAAAVHAAPGAAAPDGRLARGAAAEDAGGVCWG